MSTNAQDTGEEWSDATEPGEIAITKATSRSYNHISTTKVYTLWVKISGRRYAARLTPKRLFVVTRRKRFARFGGERRPDFFAETAYYTTAEGNRESWRTVADDCLRSIGPFGRPKASLYAEDIEDGSPEIMSAVAACFAEIDKMNGRAAIAACRNEAGQAHDRALMVLREELIAAAESGDNVALTVVAASLREEVAAGWRSHLKEDVPE